MPPYDRRARQRGFNTRIPIYTLSGGVGRQAPSKRLPSEAQVMDNATPSLEKSIEKRANSTQLTTYVSISEDIAQNYGGLGLPFAFGATSSMSVSTLVATAADITFSLNNFGAVGSTLRLISTDETIEDFIVTKLGNSGYETEATASFTFNTKAVHESAIQFEDSDGTKKRFEARDKLTDPNGTLDGSYLLFNSGFGVNTSPSQNAYQAALNFQDAFYSSNGFNNNSSASMTFNGPATLNETITFTSAKNVTKTYQSKLNGSVTNGDLAGSIVLFNAGTTATEAADNLEEAINSANGHNDTSEKASATWTFNSATPADGLAKVTLLILNSSGSTVSKTYVAASSGNNGDLDGSDIKFLQGSSFNEVAINFQEALLSSNGHGSLLNSSDIAINTTGVTATTTFTFSTAATANGTLALTDVYGTTKTYKAISGCTDCPKLNSGNIEFNNGTGKVSAAQNFVEAVNNSVGHNGTIAAAHLGSGVVKLTQNISGTVGNTTVTSAAGWDTACSVNPTNFTSGAGGGEVTITQPYTGTAGNTTVTDTTEFAAACSSAPPAAFTGGTTGGASGTDFTVLSSSGTLTLTNTTNSIYSTSRIELSPRFGNALAVKPNPRFGKIHCEVLGQTGQLNFEQCVAGNSGANRSIAVYDNFNDACSKNPPTSFSRLGYVYISRGSSATNFGKEIKGAIENSDLSGKMTVTESSGTITITQVASGVAGNTSITTGHGFTDAVTSLATTFTGGKDIKDVLNGETFTLEDVNGYTQKFVFSSKKEASTRSTVSIYKATTINDIADEIAKAVNLNQRLRITASANEAIVTLKMDDPGGDGLIPATSTDKILTSVFKNANIGGDYFYYWFSVSDALRYLLVVNYKAVVGEELFYVYKVDTLNNKVENQTPEILQQPTEEVYNYITHKNETKTAREALEGITIGTNIYILNKFVKAGYSSGENGFLFDLDGVEITDDIDYKGKEVIYYTSSVVDPEGTAQLYIPNKAYASGAEVYNAYGVWKAVTDIRAESSNTFGSSDTEETVTPADPGPPNYLTSSDGGDPPDFDHNIWYPYTAIAGAQPSAAIVETGKNRIRLNSTRTSFGTGIQTALTEWASSMTPSVETDNDLERKWKETTENSSGIETEEGDLVYDIAHSRKVADKGSGASGSEAQDDEYITLWQYLRPVAQIPVEDNRYVIRSQQYIGQSFSDFSNVRLPPHPSDPTDIIDKVDEIDRYDDGNRTGDAAKTIGILYEGKEPSDYDNENNTTTEFGLGKIIFVENSYSGIDPGYYRFNSIDKPYVEKVRTPFKYSRFDEKRMPHKMTFIPPTDTENARWDLSPENWTMRVSGTDNNNPGPKIFEEGKQTEIKSMGFFRNRLWLAGEDKVFSSKLNEINNFWIDDPTSLTDEDPIDVTCSFNKYTEVVSLTPFEEFLFVNTGSDVQFTLKGSDNQITPFTAEISPTSFYSTAPLVQPVLLGSQIYFFDKKRVYVYFNEKTVSINNAIEVSYHCPDYLPENFGESAVVSPYDTLLTIDQDNKKDVYCYTNRYSGEQVIQNSFFKYSYNNENETIHSWDNDIYTVIKTQKDSEFIYHIVKQPFKQLDTVIPLSDNSKSIILSPLNTSYDSDKDITTFTFDSYYNPNIDTLNILDRGSDERRGETLAIQSTTITPENTKITVDGKYLEFNKGLEVSTGTKFKTVVELSPLYYRDEANNVVDGVLSLRTMHIRHHNTGNYRVNVTRQGRTTTPIVFTSKFAGSATDLMPLERTIENGETVAKILGFSDEVKIEFISDYTTPMNITNIELKGRFNATYSSWVR